MLEIKTCGQITRLVITSTRQRRSRYEVALVSGRRCRQIPSLVSANTTAGISVVRYTGNGSASATIGHGLGGVLNGIWQKDMTATDSWHINASAPSSDLGLASGYGLYFNNNNAAQNPGDGSMDNFTATTFGFYPRLDLG